MLNNILHLVLFIIFSTCSSTLLWRIETSPPSYIFGTIHIPYNLVWPYVSKEIRQAFMSSTHFYAEIDVKNDAFWDDFLLCLVNRSKRIERSTNSATRGELLDVYLLVEARRLNKTVGSLESAEYHCEQDGWRYNLTTWIIMLDYIKNRMKNARFSIDDIKHYVNESIINDYICNEIDSKYMKILFITNDEIRRIDQRDEQISRNIHRLLYYSNNNRYFFAIGAGHMLGKRQNLIVQLKKFGYKITRICTYQNHIKKKFGCKKKINMKNCLKRKAFVKQ
ncbi:unnamed protein product [Rotaria sordida]|uniref:Metalloprotease TIKI homolog n=1 Tax=Rotaria sordida TaxID=392033 RepID=A0A815D9Y6_9BILA|nr:unnamed protein product [Rotaria sordida]CAF1294219.1 unnamed protein product [Rotaria sordida]